MFRAFLCAVLALVLVSGTSLAAGKGKGKGKRSKPVAGTVTKYDAATGELTLSTGAKKAKVEKQFKLGDAGFVVFEGETPKSLSNKDGSKELKAGDKVRLHVDADGKVTKVEINPPKKKKK
jgi:hypothetical protein